MPQVPRYIGRGQARSVPMPFAPQLDVTRGQRGFAKTLGGVGEEFRRAKQASDLTIAMSEAVTSLNDLETVYSNQANPDLNKFQADVASLHDTIIGNMQDAVTRQAFASRFSNIAASTRHNVTRVARKRIEETGRASLDASLFTLRSSVALAKTEAQKQAILEEAVNQVNDAYNSGFLNAEQRVNMLQGFAGNIEEDEIRASIMGDPETAMKDLTDPTRFTYMDEGRRLTLLERAQTQVRLNDEREARAETRLEKRIAQIKKDLVADADFDTWQLEFNQNLDNNELERRANLREISQTAYVQIQRRRRDKPGGTGYDNPLVVGDLAYQIALGIDVRKGLQQAVKDGHIKDSTYISKMTALGAKHYSLANKLITTALQPGPFEQYRPDKNKRMAEAIERLDTLINRKEDAVESALTIIYDYTSDLRRNVYNLPRPRYLPEGKESRQSEQAMDKAILDTYDAYNRGALSDREYRYEMNKIEQMQMLTRDITQATIAQEDVGDRIKEILRSK